MSSNIRLATENDAGAVAAIYAPFCGVSVVSFEVAAPSDSDMAGRIRAVSEKWPWLVLDDDGAIAGYAYASRHRDRAAYQWTVDTAVYVGEGYRGRGVGRSLYTALFELLRSQGYFKACAGIALPNPASVALHEAVGFTLVGVYRGIGYKLGAWRDVAWYELALQPERENPPPPTPISGLKAS
ncbi:MAG TPA: arsinothricin resistance N-acetyltransferase ArsN1 family B [Vicinamibacterales bacterium]|jgi:phosphinothricin acetyltransferase|nr:arsinothricin resistance N-acetyltransferase ArsN1 family B [Vicinamibacterales bacterium]